VTAEALEGSTGGSEHAEPRAVWRQGDAPGMWGTATSSSHCSPCTGRVRTFQRHARDRRGRVRERVRASVNLKTATSGFSFVRRRPGTAGLASHALCCAGSKRTARVKQLAMRVTLVLRGRQADSDEKHKTPAGAAGASIATRMCLA
jgi:hypothetical protein